MDGQTTASYTLVVNNEKNQLVARIDSTTGEIEFGPGAPVEDRAREFWRLLAQYAPLKPQSREEEK